MTVHSENQKIASTVLWADAELNSIGIDYDIVTLNIVESTGIVKIIKCLGYIGYSAVGVWDDIIIDCANVLNSDDFLDECLLNIKVRLGDKPAGTGSKHRNSREYSVLKINMGDDSTILVAFNTLEVFVVP